MLIRPGELAGAFLTTFDAAETGNDFTWSAVLTTTEDSATKVRRLPPHVQLEVGGNDRRSPPRPATVLNRVRSQTVRRSRTSPGRYSENDLTTDRASFSRRLDNADKAPPLPTGPRRRVTCTMGSAGRRSLEAHLCRHAIRSASNARRTAGFWCKVSIASSRPTHFISEVSRLYHRSVPRSRLRRRCPQRIHKKLDLSAEIHQSVRKAARLGVYGSIARPLGRFCNCKCAARKKKRAPRPERFAQKRALRVLSAASRRISSAGGD
jgi:hypothetical protein